MKSEKLNLSELDKLARLMATENIIVQHGQTQTAYFDTEGRILMLPMWKDISKSLYHMLTGHEIGHALYTPADGWKAMVRSEPHLQAYANILEDARIEKLVKDKYPGSRKDFREGYQELFDRDFFELQKRNVNVAYLGLADRINLHYKIGHIINVPFAKEEMKWLDRVEKLKTFDDVLRLSRELFRENANQKQPSTGQEHGQEKEDDTDNNQGQKGSGRQQGKGKKSTDGQNKDQGESDEGQESQSNQPGQSDPNHRDASKGVHSSSGDEEGDEEGEGEGEGGGKSSDEDQSDPNELNEGAAGTSSVRMSNSDLGGAASTESNQTNEPWTNSTMESGMSQRIVDLNAKPFKYLTLDTTVPTNEFVIPYNEIVAEIRRLNTNNSRLSRQYGKHYKRLINRNRNSVNYLLKEFELRKAADITKRTKVTKTGVLNPTRLHAYKFTDDIFRRGQYVAEGKNHSIVMFVDFSGSMQDLMKDTIEHLFNLVSFCRKANIPHKVYAFTNAYQHWREADKTTDVYDAHRKRRDMMQTRANGKSNLLTANLDMHLLELYSHEMSLGDFREMTEALVENFSGSRYTRPYRMFDLNSTPLDGAVVLAHKLVQDFKKTTKTEIVSTIFLTDGDSSGACLLNRNSSNELNAFCDQNTVLQKRWSSYRNTQKNGYGFMTDMLLRSLAEEGFHVIGYRIGQLYELERQLNSYGTGNSTEINKKIEELNKDGSCTLKDYRGYQEYHYLVMNSTKSTEKFKLDDNIETTDELSNAFIDETTTRLVSRRILNNIARKISGKVSTSK